VGVSQALGDTEGARASLAAAAAIPFIGPLAKVLRAVDRMGEGGEGARTRVEAAQQLGRTGEAAVRALHDIGPSQSIKIGDRTRFPDGLTPTTLSEVKNVQSLSYTSQLRDYAAFARQEGLAFDLYVRQGAHLSGPLQEAIRSGAINLRFIPQ
jgi:nucleotide-binding universal stress UspA family protein